jgi:hypothetical protein
MLEFVAGRRISRKERGGMVKLTENVSVDDQAEAEPRRMNDAH